MLLFCVRYSIWYIFRGTVYVLNTLLLTETGIIVCMRPANERRRNVVSHWLGAYIAWSLQLIIANIRTQVRCCKWRQTHGPLTRYEKLWVAHAPGMPGMFSRHRLKRKPLVGDPGMHHGTCVTHVPRCMSGSLTIGGGKNVPGIPGACATWNFTYLMRCPCNMWHIISSEVQTYRHHIWIQFCVWQAWIFKGEESFSQQSHANILRFFASFDVDEKKIRLDNFSEMTLEGTSSVYDRYWFHTSWSL